MLAEREWRGRISAAWLIGLGRREAFVDRIGELLLASQLAFAGQGYCVALALIGTARCREILQEYLRTFLPPAGREYDQLWALAALAYLDAEAAEALTTEKLWPRDQWPRGARSEIQPFTDLMAFVTSELMDDA